MANINELVFLIKSKIPALTKAIAELVSVPEKNIYEVPKALDTKEAALAEPTAVALHAVILAKQTLKKSSEKARKLTRPKREIKNSSALPGCLVYLGVWRRILMS